MFIIYADNTIRPTILSTSQKSLVRHVAIKYGNTNNANINTISKYLLLYNGNVITANTINNIINKLFITSINFLLITLNKNPRTP